MEIKLHKCCKPHDQIPDIENIKKNKIKKKRQKSNTRDHGIINLFQQTCFFFVFFARENVKKRPRQFYGSINK